MITMLMILSCADMFSSHADRIMCVSILLLQNLHCFYIIIFNRLGDGDAVGVALHSIVVCYCVFGQ